jgi:Flp pilus assembly pilin Flp
MVTAIEYGLITGLIGVVIVGAVSAINDSTTKTETAQGRVVEKGVMMAANGDRIEMTCMGRSQHPIGTYVPMKRAVTTSGLRVVRIDPWKQDCDR